MTTFRRILSGFTTGLATVAVFGGMLVLANALPRALAQAEHDAANMEYPQ
ncbi:hypothetical protein [Pararhodobacter marinus]|nr:hypothetical protein [Pararhodobacter marinus]